MNVSSCASSLSNPAVAATCLVQSAGLNNTNCTNVTSVTSLQACANAGFVPTNVTSCVSQLSNTLAAASCIINNQNLNSTVNCSSPATVPALQACSVAAGTSQLPTSYASCAANLPSVLTTASCLVSLNLNLTVNCSLPATVPALRACSVAAGIALLPTPIATCAANLPSVLTAASCLVSLNLNVTVNCSLPATVPALQACSAAAGISLLPPSVATCAANLPSVLTTASCLVSLNLNLTVNCFSPATVPALQGCAAAAGTSNLPTPIAACAANLPSALTAGSCLVSLGLGSLVNCSAPTTVGALQACVAAAGVSSLPAAYANCTAGTTTLNSASCLVSLNLSSAVNCSAPATVTGLQACAAAAGVSSLPAVYASCALGTSVISTASCLVSQNLLTTVNCSAPTTVTGLTACVAAAGASYLPPVYASCAVSTTFLTTASCLVSQNLLTAVSCSAPNTVTALQACSNAAGAANLPSAYTTCAGYLPTVVTTASCIVSSNSTLNLGIINCATSNVASTLQACYYAGGTSAVPNVPSNCLTYLMTANLPSLTTCLLGGSILPRRGLDEGGFGIAGGYLGNPQSIRRVV